MSDATASIREEIGQNRPFQSVEQAAVVSLLRTASLVRRRFEQLAGEEELTFQQYNVLRILRGAGEPLPTMTIGERLIEETPGITRLLGRLESKAFIRRERSAEDRRQVLCQLTEKGREVVRRLDAPMNALDESCMEGVAAAEQEALLHILAKVRAQLPEQSG